MPRRRLELPRHFCHRYLKPARLPIPPPGRRGGGYLLGRTCLCQTLFDEMFQGVAPLCRTTSHAVASTLAPRSSFRYKHCPTAPRPEGRRQKSGFGESDVLSVSGSHGFRRVRVHRPPPDQTVGEDRHDNPRRDPPPEQRQLPAHQRRGRPDHSDRRQHQRRRFGRRRGARRRHRHQPDRHPVRIRRQHFPRHPGRSAGPDRPRRKGGGRSALRPDFGDRRRRRLDSRNTHAPRPPASRPC